MGKCLTRARVFERRKRFCGGKEDTLKTMIAQADVTGHGLRVLGIIKKSLVVFVSQLVYRKNVLASHIDRTFENKYATRACSVRTKKTNNENSERGVVRRTLSSGNRVT